MRRRVVDNFKNKLRFFSTEIIDNNDNVDSPPVKISKCRNSEISTKETAATTRTSSAIEKLKPVLTSYLAYSSKANSFRIIQKTISQHKWIDKIFKISGTKAAFSEEITQEYERIVFGFY